MGTRIVEILSPEFEFEDLSFDTGIDITDRDAVFSRIKTSPAGYILHMAAKTDVDGCEKDKPMGVLGPAWKINVGGTQNIADAAQKFKKRVIYISTDFIFDGQKDSYQETDQPHPISWYGMTKLVGEKKVLSDPDNIVIRISYPYRAKCPRKKDFVHNIYQKLLHKEILTAITDQIFTPTFIDDIADAIRILINKNASGIFQVNGSSSLTPYAAVLEIARVFGGRTDLIKTVTTTQFYKDRAPRPLKMRMNNDKIVKFGVKMHTFSEGLLLIKQQGGLK